MKALFLSFLIIITTVLPGCKQSKIQRDANLCDSGLPKRKDNKACVTTVIFNFDSIYTVCRNLITQRLGNCNSKEFITLSDTFNSYKRCNTCPCMELNGYFKLPDFILEFNPTTGLEIPPQYVPLKFFICNKNDQTQISFSRLPFCSRKENCGLTISHRKMEEILVKNKLLDFSKYHYSVEAEFTVLDKKTEGLFWRIRKANSQFVHEYLIDMQSGRLIDLGESQILRFD